jgi:phenylacetate-CoA ligase
MGIDAVDIYGLSEVMGPGVASECVETKDGPTIWEDHFYPEIIDPDTGANCCPTESLASWSSPA